jgi:hypothetical protein
VTGFLATEWNEFGGYYTVRQRDAHAWVEVYYPESGWITLDPTPSTTAVLTPSLWIAFQRMGESLRLHWDRVFIQYGGRDQLAILRGLWEGSQSAHGALEQWMSGVGEASIRFFWTSTERAWKASRGLRGMFIAALGIGAVVVIVWASQRWLHARSAGQPPARTQQQIVHLYKKIRELAARRGIPISPSTTPTELTQLVSERWTDADSAVQRVTALYCRTRFGLGRLSGEEHKQAVEDIGFLKRLMHQPRLLRR